MEVEIDISRLESVFGAADGVTFVALLAQEVFECLRLVGSSGYRAVSAIPVTAAEVPHVVKSLDGPCHIFCVTTEASFFSPPQDALMNKKIGVLPLYSTGYSVAKLKKALQIITQLDYSSQYQRSKKLIAELDYADRIIFESRKFQTTATLELSGSEDGILFFNQSGPIDWGHQSVLPNGELSLLTNRHGCYSRESVFPLDGELLFGGYPILHHGTCPCHIARAACAELLMKLPPTRPLFGKERLVLAGRQQSIFRDLAEMRTGPCVARVKRGVIEDLRPFGQKNSFFRQLTQLFESDDNYRKIHEIGFGLNPCTGFFLDDNFLPNEMRLGVHFGLGLTPYTEFHLDLACAEISVLAETRSGRRIVLDPAESVPMPLASQRNTLDESGYLNTVIGKSQPKPESLLTKAKRQCQLQTPPN